jgi:hypothetical protein
VHRVQHWAGPRESVQLLNVGRYSVTCRVHGRRAGYDLRVPFAAVVDRVDEVPEAIRLLTACAHDLAGDVPGRDQPRR